jgi:L-lactate permease
MRNYLALVVLFLISFSQAQELCSVVVDYSKIINANTSFKNLQVALNDFVNKTVWTEKKMQQQKELVLMFYNC